MRLVKTLCGCMESLLLYYDLYLSKLIGFDFELNLHDKCVAKIYGGIKIVHPLVVCG